MSGAREQGRSPDGRIMRELHRREVVRTANAPGPSGAYSQGMAREWLVATAGQVGIDPRTGILADGVAAQTRQALSNVAAVLDAAGATWTDVLKTTCFLADIADFETFDAAYEEMVPDPRPSRSTVGVSLPGRLLVEIEAMAVVSGAHRRSTSAPAPGRRPRGSAAATGPTRGGGGVPR